MAEVKKEDTAREFTVEFDEKKTKKIGEGMRQLIFENFGKLGADFRILTFQNAKGLVGVDFMLPESARVSFSTSYTSRIKHYGLLEGLQIDFVRQGWAPASDLPWHVEPSPGWSFELAIEISREKDV